MTNNQKRIIDELIAELRPIVKQAEVTETAVTPTKGYDTLEGVYGVSSLTGLPELPSGYESTGAFRVVRKGDYFLGAGHSAVEFPIRVHSYTAAFEGSYRLIVKPVDLEAKARAAYNVARIADILVPEGYEAVEFRKLRMGDVFSGAQGGTDALINESDNFTGDYRMVIRPIPAPDSPTIFEIYGTHDLSTISIPEGYVSAGFRSLKTGESFISADGGRVLKSSMVHSNPDDLFNGSYRLVVQKAPPAPTMMDVYGVRYISDLTLPAGYRALYFGQAKEGDMYVGFSYKGVTYSGNTVTTHDLLKYVPYTKVDFSGYRLIVEKVEKEPALREKIDLPATNTGWAALENILATNVKDYGIEAVLIALANIFDKKARETTGALSGSMNNTAQQLTGLATRMTGRFKKEGQV